MHRRLKAKIDIVLSDGVFLKRGGTYEVNISKNEYNFIAPYVEDLTPPVQDVIKEEPKQPQPAEVVEDGEKPKQTKKRKTTEALNELD